MCSFPKSPKIAVGFMALLVCPLLNACAAPAEEKNALIELFDGSTLNGWRGDSNIWSVKDGALTGGSDNDISDNTFLIRDGNFSNFELRYKYRLTGSGNSGVQIRSIVSDHDRFLVQGYQANVVPIDQAERFGMLWEEGGRGELALLGHEIVIGVDGDKVTKNVLSSTNPRDVLLGSVRSPPEWNEVVVIAFENRIIHALNGYLLFDATDNDPAGRKDGVIAIQAHSGPPMQVQIKDIKLELLEKMPDISERFTSEPGPPTPAEPGPRVARH